MESLGLFAEADQWECFSRLFSNNEDQEFNEGAFPFQHNEVFNFENQAILFPNSEDGDQMGLAMFNQSLYHSLDTLNSNIMHYVNYSQENSNSDYSDHSNNEIFTTPSILTNPESYYYGDNSCYNMSSFIDGNVDDGVASFVPNFSGSGNVCNNGDSGSAEMAMSDESQPTKELQLKRVHEEISNKDDASDHRNPRKKPRLSKDKAKKSNVRQKKGQKVNSKTKEENEDENNATIIDRGSSSYDNSEDDIASQETNEAGEVSDPKSSSALNLNGKTRANIGSATDPQSLYARKRRERINERLRVLQNLVPNGTKVDISTMLEEAVHYVKFLQLQIKLLSSDDMWMYSPIAYNGMDIGLDLHKMCPTVL